MRRRQQSSRSRSSSVGTLIIRWMAVPSICTSCCRCCCPASSFLPPHPPLPQQRSQHHHHNHHPRQQRHHLHGVHYLLRSSSTISGKSWLNACPTTGANSGRRQTRTQHNVVGKSNEIENDTGDDDDETTTTTMMYYGTTKKLKRKTPPRSSSSSSTTTLSSSTSTTTTTTTLRRQSPFPTMPSPLFVDLAKSQFELLSNSLLLINNNNNTTTTSSKQQQSKIHSMVLYLPKENPITGRLEFVPALSIPDPSSSSSYYSSSSKHKRIFIASSVEHSNKSGGVHQPPSVPEFVMRKGALRLPGFFSAKELIPSYPFVTSSGGGSSSRSSSSSSRSAADGGSESGIEASDDDDDDDLKAENRHHEIITVDGYDSSIGVSAVEEIPMMMSSSSKSSGDAEKDEIETGGCTTSLSVTLFNGLDTLGVLMIWPNNSNNNNERNNDEDEEDDNDDANSVLQNRREWTWTSEDKLQVSRAAKSLALALSMDGELATSRLANDRLCVAMADGLHQVKSPLQALRTFGKLLRRQLAEEGYGGSGTSVGSATIVGMERIPTTTMKSGGGDGGRGRRHALKLAEDMLSQGERVVDLIEPMDALVRDSMEGGSRYLLRGDVHKEEEEISSSSSSSSSTLRLRPSDNIVMEIPQEYRLPPPMPIMGDFTLEMAFPQDVLGSIVYASQAVSRETGINFDVYGFDPENLDLPGVSVCTKYLKEAISNLLDNAIKYAPVRRRGKVGRPRIPQIKVSLVPNDRQLFSPGATVYIEDNGPGIPPQERNKVFERGYRGEGVQDEVDGSGLGLALAREMISKMGGLLDIVDEGPNKLNGTTFRVVLFRDQERNKDIQSTTP